MKKVIPAIALMLTAAPAVTVASEYPEEILTPAAIEFLEETATIQDVWRINEHLIGIALEVAPQQGMVVFADASGRYLVSGAAIDTETGVNLAEAAAREKFPEPGPADMYREAENINWIATRGGDTSEGPIYIVADTQCGYCHELARMIEEEGVEREIRWILVGYLGPKSTNQAAGLLELPPEQAGTALRSILTGQADGAPQEVPERGAGALEANERWAQKWRIGGTPMLLVPHNGQIHKVSGLPGRSLWEIIAP